MEAANGAAVDPGVLSRIELAEGVVASLARRVIALEDAGAVGLGGSDASTSRHTTDGSLAGSTAVVTSSGGPAGGAPAAADTAGNASAAAAAEPKYGTLLSQVLLQLSDLRAGMVSLGQAHQAEVAALAEDNAKLRYRIKHLLRALDAADGYASAVLPAVRGELVAFFAFTGRAVDSWGHGRANDCCLGSHVQLALELGCFGPESCWLAGLSQRIDVFLFLHALCWRGVGVVLVAACCAARDRENSFLTASALR